MVYCFKEAKKTSWYQKGGMVGYTFAKKNLESIEAIIKNKKLSKTNIQKFIIKKVLDFNKIDWHYFNNFSKKDIAHLKHALKKINKTNIVSELYWIEARTGMLRTSLTKTLHVLAYKLQPQKYLEYASKDYKFYGMNDNDAKKRALTIVNNFMED